MISIIVKLFSKFNRKIKNKIYIKVYILIKNKKYFNDKKYQYIKKLVLLYKMKRIIIFIFIFCSVLMSTPLFIEETPIKNYIKKKILDEA